MSSITENTWQQSVESSRTDRDAFVKECMETLDGEDADAASAYRLRLVLDGKDTVPLYRLAQLCRWNGYAALWHRGLRVFLSYPALTHEQRYYRAHARLILGDWSGWEDYEARFHRPGWRSAGTELGRRLEWSRQRWNGDDDCRDKILLVVAEQGFGDIIQMLRFLPLLRGKARRVLLAVPPELESLVSYNYGHLLTVLSLDASRSIGLDRYVWILSLPRIFSTLPPFDPLVAPKPRLVLSRDRSLKVGLCWSGSTFSDRRRLLPVGQLSPLLDHQEIQWHSLQVGPETRQVYHRYRNLREPAPALLTFADTANVISELDCVVTIDTSVAHLAGALGIPTYLLLWAGAEWRWGLADKTPWYPSMELIRQPVRGDWTTPIEDVQARLQRLSPHQHDEGRAC